MLKDYDLRQLITPLGEWFQKNARELPWRENPTPYQVWVSEIMLQQTTVKSVTAYFSRWMKRFPTLHWDISGTGLFRWGMLKYLVDTCGAEKLLFGTDFPICNIAMQIHGVLSEHIPDEARAAIFSGNFDRLCGRGK